MRRVLLLIWLALVGIQLALGVTWVAQNVGKIPDYGDTGDYLQLARTLEVDAYRGIAYPAFIAGVDRLPGGGGLLRAAGKAVGPKWKGGVVYLQVIQLAASLACLLYFLRVSVARVGARGAAALLVLLLFLDPLLAHMDLSIMTDSLALSGSLAFCAALAQFGLGTTRRAVSGLVLLAAFVLTAALRVEKLWVLACATFATLVVWLYLQRGLPRTERWFSLPRAGQITGLVLLGAVTVLALQRGAQADSKRWPMYDSALHSRIVFPNVSKVYDELPKNVQARISRQEAVDHDTNSIVGYRIINAATGASGPVRKKDRATGARPSADAERRALLESIAGVVLRERWAPLAADVLKDVLENTAATFSFYARLAILARTGDVPRAISCADGTQKTYEVLSQRRPRTSFYYVCSSAAVFLASTALALAAFVRRRRAGKRLERRTWLSWVPVAGFVLANACAFALRADMVHIRYMLLAHTAFLALAYRGALAWFEEEPRLAPAAVSSPASAPA